VSKSSDIHFVIGAEGQIGRFLCRKFCSEKKRFFHSSRNAIQINGSNGGMVLDIAAKRPLRNFLIENHVTSVVVLASRCKPGQQNDSKEETYSHNVHFLTELIEDFKGTYVRKIFFASSREIFGDEPGEFSEVSPVNPRNFYAESKILGEKILSDFGKNFGVDVVTGIFFNQESGFRKVGFVRDVLSQIYSPLYGRPTDIHCDFDFEKDWTHASDGAAAISKLLDLSHPGRFVISRGQLHSANELVSELALQSVGADICIKFKDKDVRYGQLGLNKKIRSLAGWLPMLSLNEMAKQINKEFLYDSSRPG
jgi:nucleoside-diphosphate-sugar epimerase